MTEFAILTAVIITVLNAWQPNHGQRNAIVAGLAGLLFAVSDEFHQTYVPYRFGSVEDVFIDAIGVMSVAAISCLRHSAPSPETLT